MTEQIEIENEERVLAAKIAQEQKQQQITEVKIDGRALQNLLANESVEQVEKQEFIKGSSMFPYSSNFLFFVVIWHF